MAGSAVPETDATAYGKPHDIDGDGTVDAVCEGGTRHTTGFYGAGIADALDAVRR